MSNNTGVEHVLPVRRLAATGLDARAQVVGNRYEGLVAKDEAGVYEGGPTTPWLKVKQKDDGRGARLAAAILKPRLPEKQRTAIRDVLAHLPPSGRPYYGVEVIPTCHGKQ